MCAFEIFYDIHTTREMKMEEDEEDEDDDDVDVDVLVSYAKAFTFHMLDYLIPSSI